MDSAISKTWQKLSSNPIVSLKFHYNLMKEVMCMMLLITTVHVWAKSLVREQSDLTKWGMAQRRPRLTPNGTNVFASLGTAKALQQLIAPDRSQAVIGTTLPFPEGFTWNHSLLISRSGQGCHCESSFCLVSGFRGSLNSAGLEMICILQVQINVLLLSSKCCLITPRAIRGVR